MIMQGFPLGLKKKSIRSAEFATSGTKFWVSVLEAQHCGKVKCTHELCKMRKEWDKFAETWRLGACSVATLKMLGNMG